MNKQTFIQLIKDPSGITPEQLQELEKVVSGFPYCQSAHILIAKQAADTGSMLADQKLKKAAAYTIDRKNLKRLLQGTKEINKKEFVITPVELKPIEPVVDTIEVTKEENTILKEVNTVTQIPQKEEVVANPNEPLTDDKRDQIIKELQENLKRLHEIKIKTAWEEVPEEIKVVGVNAVKEDTTVEEKETSFIEEEIKNEEIVETESVVEVEPVITLTSTTDPVIQDNDLPVTQTESNIFISLLNPDSFNYPIRTEDVMVEIKETEADPKLLLEYLDFLEDKRSIFRKNKKKEDEIIEKFIREEPTIPKLDINNLPDNSVDLSSKSSKVLKGPISENFAKILSLQGKKEKAIEIYEQLILKNPEKKPYFEAQIEKLKNKI